MTRRAESGTPGENRRTDTRRRARTLAPAPGGAGTVALDPASGEAAGAAPDPGAAATGGPTAAAPKRSTGGRTTAPTGTKTTSTAPRTTTSKTTTSGGLHDVTFAGAASTNQYGTIKVTITVSGGRITAVSASYPTSPARTAGINSDAIPKLKQETLTAQSARIATVSGATYTSTSYRTSLQSALDRAGA